MLINLINFFYNTFLLPPGIFIIILSGLSWKAYRNNRKLAWVLIMFTVIFYLSSTLLCSSFLIHLLEYQYIPPAKINGDVMIVLGGGATLDTPNIHSKGHLSGAAANRLLTSIQIYHQLKIPIIFSGGKVNKTTGVEGEIAKAVLLDAGIPADKIMIENKSMNTTENARLTKQMLDKYHYQHPILITSAFHMPRSVRQFQKVGVTVLPFPTDFRSNVSNDFDFGKLKPTSEALDQLNIALKEYLGLMAAKWY